MDLSVLHLAIVRARSWSNYGKGRSRVGFGQGVSTPTGRKLPWSEVGDDPEPRCWSEPNWVIVR